jgi:subtilisin-like proprotein convertase family protein
MRGYVCFLAPLIGLALHGAAVSLQASTHTYSYVAQFQLSIPADSGQTKGWMDDAVIDVPDHIIITDLDITITLTHTSVFDLQLFLESPSGTRVLLNRYDPLSDYFEGQDYDQTIFDDEAAVSIQEGLAPFTGRFRPMSPDTLSAFDGENAYGPWRMQIYDAFFFDTGKLDEFGLFITTSSVPAPSTLALVLIGLGLIRRGSARRLHRNRS